MQKPKTKNYGAKWRIPLGLFMFFLLWAFGVAAVNFLPGVLKFVAILFIIIFYLFMFGVLGHWYMSLDILGVINPFLKFFGTVCGYIGFFLRPYALMVYGSNKKWILNLFAFVVLLIAVSLTLIFLFVNFLTLAVTIIFVLFTLFGVKKCPNCKCVMHLIDFGNVDLSKTKYYTTRNEKIGYVKDESGNNMNVYANVAYEHSGMDNTFAKTFTCGKCGTEKYGIKFKAVSEI